MKTTQQLIVKPALWSFGMAFALGVASSVIAAGNQLQPYAAAGSAPAAPWHVVGLPQQTKPLTRFSVADVDGKRALRIEAVESYGNLVHALSMEKAATKLSWRWRVELCASRKATTVR
jgi:hypothetical protein